MYNIRKKLMIEFWEKIKKSNLGKREFSQKIGLRHFWTYIDPNSMQNIRKI